MVWYNFENMDLLKFFTREEVIAGLEINDCYVRLAILEKAEERKERTFSSWKKLVKSPLKKEAKKPKAEKFYVRPIGEKSLRKKTIENGKIINKAVLVSTLKEVFKKSKVQISFVAVSIPSEKVYSKVYSFPKTVVGEKLEEAMKLNIDFQLPLRPENAYLDWEKMEDEGRNEVFLSAIPKEVIDDYIAVLTEAGFKAVAIETNGQSAARAIGDEGDYSVAILMKQKSGLNVLLTRGKAVHFSRFLLNNFYPNQKDFDQELSRIIDYYEYETKNNVRGTVIVNNEGESFSFKNLPIQIEPKLVANIEPKEEIKSDLPRWIVAVGAAIRGNLPRSSDTIVSLMPIGTEEAYEKQRAISFMHFISSAVIGLSVFFSFAFIATLIMMISLRQNFNDKLSILNSNPNPSGAGLEEKAVQFNELVAMANKILNETPKWSVALEELKARKIDDITVSSLSASSVNDYFNMAGIAKSRPQLNLFKKIMEESPLITEVNVPINNVGMKENIPFSMTFKLKTPIMLNE